MNKKELKMESGNRSRIDKIEQDLVKRGYRRVKGSLNDVPDLYEYIKSVASGSETRFEGPKQYSVKWYEKKTVS